MTQLQKPPVAKIYYPESDGKPMGESSEHIDLIITIKIELDDMYSEREDVVTGSDLFWYPIEGNNRVRIAPDVLVAFGPRKGPRSSYLQWEEGNIAPQVVIEIRSPGNYDEPMRKKFKFYQTHGVLEYYVYDLHRRILEGWLREGTQLVPIENMQGWVSPRLQVRFELVAGKLKLYRPNGDPFKDPLQIRLEVRQAWSAQQTEHQARLDAEREAMNAARQARQARLDKEEAEKLAQQERDTLEQLKAKLREMHIDPDTL